MAGLTKVIETSIGAITLRGLKRREVKQLRQEGIKFGQTLTPEEIDAAIEKSLALVLSPEQMQQLDDLYESEAMELYLELTKLSYPQPSAEKNSG